MASCQVAPVVSDIYSGLFSRYLSQIIVISQFPDQNGHEKLNSGFCTNEHDIQISTWPSYEAMHVASLPEQLFPMALNWIDASGSEQLLGPKSQTKHRCRRDGRMMAG